MCTNTEESHTHTSECYTQKLTCTKEEHTHSAECYINPNTESTPTPSSTDNTSNSDGSSLGATNNDNSIMPIANEQNLQDAIAISMSVTESTYHTPTKDADGTYLYYTGESPIVTLNITNPNGNPIEEGTVVRLYMKFTSTIPESGISSASGSPKQVPGNYVIETANGAYDYTITKVNDDTYCFEFERPNQGDAISIDLASNFPGITSVGGTNEVWAVILSKEEKEALDTDDKIGIAEKPSDGTNQQTLYWETKADDYSVTKTSYQSSSSSRPSLMGDGNNGAYITGLFWKMDYKRTAETTLESVGKDFVRYVEYTDVITLPEGAEWSETFKTLVETNNWRTVGSNKKYGYSITDKGNNVVLSVLADDETSAKQFQHITPVLSFTEDNKLKVTWRIYHSDFNNIDGSVDENSIPSKDFSSPSVYLYIYDKAVQIKEPIAEKIYTVRNEVKTDTNYSWSKVKQSTDTNDISVTVGESKLTMEKSVNYINGSFGGSGTYTITAKNDGVLPYDRLAYIEDTIPNLYYLSSENMISLFNDENYGDKLTISILNATICTAPAKKTVIKIDGTTEEVTVGNTSADGNSNKYNGMQSTDPTEQDTNATISICKENGKIVVKYNDTSTTCDMTAGALQTVLDSLGFINTNSVQYKLKWDLQGSLDKFELKGGEELTFNISFRIKSTFMFLEQDVKNTYPSSTIDSENNTVYAYTRDNEQITSAKDGRFLKLSREYTLTKNAVLSDGETELENVPTDGEIITYTLNVVNRNGYLFDKTEFVPLVDHMSGIQLLLAEVNDNKDKEWAKDLDVYTDSNGVQYYKLDKYGTYENVSINGLIADSVTVSKTDTGLDTLIKWYFESTYSTSGKNFTYKALVNGSDLAPDAIKYTINNESWLGDHESHRLYATLGAEGVTFLFDKKIVSEDDITATTKEVGEDTSNISEGETVYYRFTIYPTGTAYTLTGSAIRDALPLCLIKNNTEYLKWSKSDSFDSGSVWIESYQGYKEIQNKDYYYIDDSNESDQEYIKWDDDFSITVKEDEPVYIYVRLTFPKDSNWQEYGSKYGSTTLYNTLYIFGVPSYVSHNLKIPATAYLQKGVYTNLSYKYFSGNQLNVLDQRPSFSKGDNSLLYYSNNDGNYRAVVYYAVLYNDGDTRLYIQDIQDILPKGFTFKSLANYKQAIVQDTWTTHVMSNNIGLYEQITQRQDYTNVNWKAAKISASIDEDNPQKITFKISQCSDSDYKSQFIKYDKTRKMYYLNPGEGINFGYICATNEYADTEDSAINSISMPYYNYNGGGVEVSDTSFTNTQYGTSNSNDGDCNVIDNSQASLNGYTGGSNDTKWLESNVTVTRGDIKPGITKALTALIEGNGNKITSNIVSANSTDTLCWTITADNDGYSTLTDYTLTDIMPKPYLFNGKVNYVLSNGRKAYNDYLFEVGELNDGKIELTSNDETTRKTLTINGDPVTLDVRLGYYGRKTYTAYDTLQIEVQIKEIDSEYALYIRFINKEFAIGEQQSGTLSVNTINTTNIFKNTVYVNQCFITPTVQTWDGSVNKGNYTTLDVFDEEEKKATVRNSAPVTVSYGYTTGSIKSVTQLDDATNTTDSTQEVNYIVLPNKETEFTYTLSVTNSDKSLKNLTIIDSLPEVGDHTCFQNSDARFSEFKVSLADDLNMKVTVKLEDGTVNTLDDSQYTVEYSTKTEFDSSDWNGSSTWGNESNGARSLRIKINDDTGNLMPAKSIVSVSFNAKIDGDANPGQIAWNSFGYHYSVVGSSAELEAAPLKVGVMIPTMPTIQKSLVDDSNNAITATKDETFEYVIYTGSSLKLTGDELLNKLMSDNRKFTVVETTVKKGESQTDKISLDNCKAYTYSNNTLEETEEGFAWNNNSQYTIVELEDEDSFYEYKSTNKNTSSTGYTFTYANNVSINLSVVNKLNVWDFSIKKIDSESKATLQGAYFALYSSYENDAMSLDDYEALSVKPEKTIEHDEKIWYLVNVSSTGNEGTINWNNLGRDKYIFTEVKAPIGYELSEDIYEVEKANSNGETVEIENHLAYVTLTANKEWIDSDNEYSTRPESITVYVKNGDTVEDTLTLDSSNNWSATSKKLLKYDSTGKEIEYKLVEKEVDGYYATSNTNEDGSITFKNTLTSVSISKVDNYFNVLEGAKLQVLDGDTKIDEWVSTTSVHVIKGLKIGTTYTIKEVEAPEGYLLTEDIKFTIDSNGTVTTSTNVIDDVIQVKDTPIEKTTFTVNKVWNDSDNKYNTRPTSIEVQLTQTLNGETTNVGDAATLTSDSWSYTWNDLPTTDENGKSITYKAVEVSALDNYTTSVSEDGKTITNTLKTGNLTFTKTISGSITEKDLENLYFVISGPNGYSKEVKYSEMTNVVSGKRTYTIEGLLPGEYTVEEKNAEVSGYSITTTYKDGSGKQVEVDKTTTIDISNEYKKNESPKEEEPKKETPTTEYHLVRTDTH